MNQTKLNPARSESRPMAPVVHEFDCVPNVLDSFRRFSRLKNCLLLESSKSVRAATGELLGQFTFLTAEPFAWFQIPVGSKLGFEQIRTYLSRFSAARAADLPPFQGGLAGLLGYDLNRSLEAIPGAAQNDFDIPAMALGLYDIVLAWDHEADRAFLISQGFPELEIGKRQELAHRRIEQFLDVLASSTENLPIATSSIPVEEQLPFGELAPVYPVPGPAGLLSNFSKTGYIDTVTKAIEYIHSGDIFQVNLAQRLLYRANCSASQLYERLRRCNPAPFAGFFDVGSSQVISASPERFISTNSRLGDRVVETRPIKGTCKRTRYPEVDLHARKTLKFSEKDRSENTMIVDLMRNDFSRVCEDDSVLVTQLCELEEYESVIHLVSAVQGRMRESSDIVDLLEAVFPGGSITGAPKIRAMEIIAELEPNCRGAYCGSLGYLGFDGSADFNILIRTITASKGWWQIPVGGGIVSQSDPLREYEETWTKAAGMLRALTP